MPPQRRPAMTPPVVFDEAAWAEDLLRASATARRVATEARGEFDTNGVPIAQLKACDPEGPEGTQLPHCLKVYLPAPDGPHGMVFEMSGSAVDCGSCTARSGCGTQAPRCDSRRRPGDLRLEQFAELRDHARAPHRPPASVRKFAYVDSASDVRVAVPEKERHLVDALARHESPTGDRVTEAVHRWKGSDGDGHGPTSLVDLVGASGTRADRSR